MDNDEAVSKSGVSFLVLYAPDVMATVKFYTALGLEFRTEQHGSGPEHHCCQKNGLALEIYPAENVDAPIGTGMIGISVDDLDAIALSLQTAEPYILSATAQFGNGRRCVLKDPDGRQVFVFDAGDTDQSSQT